MFEDDRKEFAGPGYAGFMAAPFGGAEQAVSEGDGQTVAAAPAEQTFVGILTEEASSEGTVSEGESLGSGLPRFARNDGQEGETAVDVAAQTVGAPASVDEPPVSPPPGVEPYTQAAPYTPPPVAAPVAPPAYAPPAYTPPPYGGQPYAQPPVYAQPGAAAYAPPYAQVPPPVPPAQPVQPNPQPYGGVPPVPPAGPSPYSQFAQAQYGQQSAAAPPPAAPKQGRKREKTRTAGADRTQPGRVNMAALVIIIVIACAASGVGGGLIGANLSEGAPAVTVSGDGGVTIAPTNDITTTEAVAKKALSSVVGITSTGTYTTNSFPWGSSEQEVTGVGTGMIVDAKGYILTNSHVVMDGAVTDIKVFLGNGEEVGGTVIWSDKSLDLAIVKVEAQGLSPVELGNSDEVPIGSYVAAIGNPLGLEFNGSITQGVVSGLDRTITVSDELTGGTLTMQDLIQVDAAINSGNSGGPLLNSQGQVIGVNTAKASAEGMGFAIPINTAIPIIEKVIRDGNFERVYLGVSATDVDVIKQNYPNVEIFADEGACITDVNAGSPAEKAGLKVKDVITAIDGTAINGSNALIKQLLGYDSGDTITVTYMRGEEEQETTLTLMSASELEKVQAEENPFREAPRGNGGR